MSSAGVLGPFETVIDGILEGTQIGHPEITGAQRVMPLDCIDDLILHT